MPGNTAAEGMPVPDSEMVDRGLTGEGELARTLRADARATRADSASVHENPWPAGIGSDHR